MVKKIHSATRIIRSHDCNVISIHSQTGLKTTRPHSRNI